MSEVRTKKLAIIAIVYVFVRVSIGEVCLEKQCLIKLLDPSKDTTPEVTDVQCVIRKR